MRKLSHLLAIMNYSMTLKQDDEFKLIIEDLQIESLNGDLVDLAQGSGICQYLNLQGFNKPEKSAKVQRYQFIIEQIKKEF
mmetsp:Transcript_6812/g.11487  ORF Transcript_6812/g.11487 Transcript_6812/m.11487 type:complete len:81 (-) Transcript_6812:185-427(-)